MITQKCPTSWARIHLWRNKTHLSSCCRLLKAILKYGLWLLTEHQHSSGKILLWSLTSVLWFANWYISAVKLHLLWEAVFFFSLAEKNKAVNHVCLLLHILSSYRVYTCKYIMPIFLYLCFLALFVAGRVLISHCQICLPWLQTLGGVVGLRR